MDLTVLGFVFVFLIFVEPNHMIRQGGTAIDRGVETEAQRRDGTVLFIAVS